MAEFLIAAAMTPIVTLTLNPALDVGTRVSCVVPDKKLRCAAPRFDPGGGGINVSRAIRRLGSDAPAVFAAGGESGSRLKRLLEAEGVPCLDVSVEGSTRENFNVVEEATGREFRFCLPGPRVSAGELAQCHKLIFDSLPSSGFIVASGSLPPGVPEDFYARLAALATERGHRLVLDTSGPALGAAFAEGFFLCKPSRHEIESHAGESNVSESRLAELAQRLVDAKQCEAVVVSLGSEGALWAARESRGRLTAPTVTVRSSVGAGDSMLGAVVWALSDDRTIAEAVRWGVAAGAAAVMNPGTELFNREDVERLVALIPG